STYAVHWIVKSIGEECERWRYRGTGGQTRADRYLFSHSDAEVEEVAAKAHCSPESAEQAIARLEMTELPYDTTESGKEDAYRPDEKQALVLAETYCPKEVHPRGGIVNDRDWEAIKSARAREWCGQDFYDQTVSNLREGWRGEKHYAKHWHSHELKTEPETLKTISRKLYAGDQAKAHRDASALLALRNHHDPYPERLAAKRKWRSGQPAWRDLILQNRWPGWSRIVDKLAEDADQRAWRRLKEIGRREYALELVAKDRRKPSRADYPDHLFCVASPIEEHLQ